MQDSNSHVTVMFTQAILAARKYQVSKLKHPINNRVSDQGLHCNTLGSPESCTLEALVPEAFLNELSNQPAWLAYAISWPLVQNRFAHTGEFL